MDSDLRISLFLVILFINLIDIPSTVSAFAKYSTANVTRTKDWVFAEGSNEINQGSTEKNWYRIALTMIYVKIGMRNNFVYKIMNAIYSYDQV